LGKCIICQESTDKPDRAERTHLESIDLSMQKLIRMGNPSDWDEQQCSLYTIHHLFSMIFFNLDSLYIMTRRKVLGHFFGHF
jgi:hypothetical protein